MTKDKFLFELVDQCMYLACMDNIMIENFELRDDKEFYKQIETQFFSCIKFYKEMDDLYHKGCINEQEMDEELSDVLVLIRQKEMKLLVEDFNIYLCRTGLTDEVKNDELQKFKKELLSETIDTEFILKKIRECRELEQQDTV